MNNKNRLNNTIKIKIMLTFMKNLLKLTMRRKELHLIILNSKKF